MEEKKSNPLLIAILSIAILLIVTGAVYAGVQLGKKQAPLVIPPQTESPTQVVQPTQVVVPSTNIPDETANWKTYTNTKYGFGLSYPIGWLYGEEARDDAPLEYKVYFRPTSPAPGDLVYGLVNVLVFKSTLNIEQFIDTQLCDSPGVCASSKNVINFTVDRIPAKKVINPPGPTPSEIVIFKNGLYIFVLDISLDKSYEESLSLEQKKEIFDQILSTFKFLD